MTGRNNNKLPTNLPQLQNLIKRDPKSYTEEVRHLLSYWICQLAWSRVNQNNMTLQYDKLFMYLLNLTSV